MPTAYALLSTYPPCRINWHGLFPETDTYFRLQISGRESVGRETYALAVSSAARRGRRFSWTGPTSPSIGQLARRLGTIRQQTECVRDCECPGPIAHPELAEQASLNVLDSLRGDPQSSGGLPD
jgi:hypothetical protein